LRQRGKILKGEQKMSSINFTEFKGILELENFLRQNFKTGTSNEHVPIDDAIDDFSDVSLFHFAKMIGYENFQNFSFTEFKEFCDECGDLLAEIEELEDRLDTIADNRDEIDSWEEKYSHTAEKLADAKFDYEDNLKLFDTTEIDYENELLNAEEFVIEKYYLHINDAKRLLSREAKRERSRFGTENSRKIAERELLRC
jgi:hypothetical protein